MESAMSQHANDKPETPAPPQSTTTKIQCSFCHKSRAEVRKIVAGPSVYICDECVELCSDLIAEHDEPESLIDPVRVNAATWPGPQSVCDSKGGHTKL